MSKEMLMVVDAVANEKGVARNVIFDAMEAALASAATFAVGAALPLATAMLLTFGTIPLGVSLASLVFLMLLGAAGAKAGGAPVAKGTLRVTFWGVIAMAATYAIGSLFGTTVG